MKKLYLFLVLVGLSSQILAKKDSVKKSKVKKEEACSTSLSWQPEKQCKEESGGFIVSDNCCIQAKKIVGEKPGEGSVCCANIQDDIIN